MCRHVPSCLPTIQIGAPCSAPVLAFIKRAGRVIGFVPDRLMHRSRGGSKVCSLSDLFTLPEARDRGCANLHWPATHDYVTARRLSGSYQPRTPFVLYSLPT